MIKICDISDMTQLPQMLLNLGLLYKPKSLNIFLFIFGWSN